MSDQQQAKKLYLDDGLTMDAIAQKLGVSRRTVERWSANDPDGKWTDLKLAQKVVSFERPVERRDEPVKVRPRRQRGQIDELEIVEGAIVNLDLLLGSMCGASDDDRSMDTRRRHNVQSIKSMAGITHCWLEEAQTISADSWKVLVPTIREEGSEIWVTFNPLNRTDTVYQELVEKQRNNAYVERVNWDRNPHFPSVLDDERRSMQATDPDAYHHIWEGGFWEQSDAQILHGKWIVEDFEPASDWAGPYHGADWGFATDPTTLIRCWVHANRLYVEYEFYAVGLELDDTADRWKEDVPDCEKYIIRADSARPESISHVRRHGIPRLEPVKKWSGSVEDGIAHLRSYEKIVIHPRCKHTAEEARLYSYKTDKISGEVLPVVVDAHNHMLDGCRYALALLITARGAAKKSGVKLY